jgi:hypothetical protein
MADLPSEVENKRQTRFETKRAQIQRRENMAETTEAWTEASYLGCRSSIVEKGEKLILQLNGRVGIGR